MSGPPDLVEALAWLDYCLGETAAAMQAVKAVAVTAPGMTPAKYHELCEKAAKIITMWGCLSRWGEWLLDEVSRQGAKAQGGPEGLPGERVGA
jgi:hypothetical protein